MCCCGHNSGNSIDSPIFGRVRFSYSIDAHEGKRWPRPDYVDPATDFKAIAKMLKGLSFRYQADLVYLLQEATPNIDEICRLFAISKNDFAEWTSILDELAMSDDEIMLAWDNKRNRAANSGTWMHSMMEHLLNGYRIEAGPMRGELDAVIRLLSEMENVEVYRTE